MIVWTLQRYLFREMGREFLLTALGLIATLSLGGGVLNMIQVEELTARQLVKAGLDMTLENSYGM